MSVDLSTIPMLPRDHSIEETEYQRVLISPRIRALMELYEVTLDQLMGGGTVRELVQGMSEDLDLSLMESEVDHQIVVDLVSAYTWKEKSVPIISLQPAPPEGYYWRHFPVSCSSFWVLVPRSYPESGDLRQETFRLSSSHHTLYLVEVPNEMECDIVEMSVIIPDGFRKIPVAGMIHGPSALVPDDWTLEQIATSWFRHLTRTLFVSAHELAPPGSSSLPVSE